MGSIDAATWQLRELIKVRVFCRGCWHSHDLELRDDYVSVDCPCNDGHDWHVPFTVLEHQP